ncbi:MAG: hypothetical protein AAF317_12615 [Pseudomonadota bacterium]
MDIDSHFDLSDHLERLSKAGDPLEVQAQYVLPDARMEIMIRDRLSWRPFLGPDLGTARPQGKTTIRRSRTRLAGPARQRRR